MRCRGRRVRTCWRRVGDRRARSLRRMQSAEQFPFCVEVRLAPGRWAFAFGLFACDRRDAVAAWQELRRYPGIAPEWARKLPFRTYLWQADGEGCRKSD